MGDTRTRYARAMDAKRGGVLLRVGETLYFVPATVALTLAPAPQVARVPGAPSGLLGIALQDGDVLPVMAIGTERGPMLVCSYLGEKIGLVGGVVVGTGLFEVDPESVDAVRFGAERARSLDLASIYAGVQGEGWAGRWRA
jgi:hypothetical protein